MKALVAEDDERMAALLREALIEAGWEVVVVHDGEAAFDRLVTDTTFDVALLDWMLPRSDGVRVARRLRAAGIATPILMLTARGTVEDRIDGLDAGADDYLPKPFDLGELLARLRALARRRSLDRAAVIRVGDLVIDPASRRVSRNGVAVSLSGREFDILHLLASRPGQVVSRYHILDTVWDGDSDVRSNVIDVHIAAIRSKIDRPFGTASLTTLRGVGYRFEQQDPQGAR